MMMTTMTSACIYSFIEFNKEATFSLATSAHTKGGPNHVSYFFIWYNFFVKGFCPIQMLHPHLNTPLVMTMMMMCSLGIVVLNHRLILLS